jgi:hypothetical protein
VTPATSISDSALDALLGFHAAGNPSLSDLDIDVILGKPRPPMAIPGMERLGPLPAAGLPQPPPALRPGIPMHPVIDPKSGVSYQEYNRPEDIPVFGIPFSSAKTAVAGVEQLAEPVQHEAEEFHKMPAYPGAQLVAPPADTAGHERLAKETAGGLAKVVGGAVGVATPLMAGTALAAPIETALAAGISTLSQSSAENLLRKLDVPEEYVSLAGTLAGVLGAALGIRITGLPGMLRNAAFRAKVRSYLQDKVNAEYAAREAAAKEAVAPRQIGAAPEPGKPAEDIQEAEFEEVPPRVALSDAQIDRIAKGEPHEPTKFRPTDDSGLNQPGTPETAGRPKGAAKPVEPVAARPEGPPAPPEVARGPRPSVAAAAEAPEVSQAVAQARALERPQPEQAGGTAPVVQSERGAPSAEIHPEGEVAAVPEPRRPSNPVAVGEATTVRVPHEDRSFGARYAVREASDVIQSHNPITFEENPDYQLRNDRNYRDPRNAERILEQVAEFDPAYLINDNPTANDGPPVIAPSGDVLGGNSRQMTLARVYAQRPEAAQEYRDLLAKKAAQFGIDPAEIAAMRQPVLVREVDRELTPAESQAAVTSFNKVGTAALTSAERAVSDSARLSPQALDFISSAIESEGPEGTLAKALEGRGGTAIVNRLVDDNVISTAEKPLYIDQRGVLTQQGKDRISKLLLGRLFESADQIDRTPPSLRNKLERTVAPLSRLAGRPEWDLMPDVKRAIDLLEQTRATGGAGVDDTLRQSGLFGESKYPLRAVGIAKALESDGPVNLAKRFARYANDAAAGRTMFGEVTPQEAFSDAFGVPTGERGAAHIPRPVAKVGEALGVPQFIAQDVAPKLRSTGEAARTLIRGAVEMIAPRVGVAPKTLDATYKLKGDREKAQFILEGVTEHMRKALGPKADPALVQQVAASREDLTDLGLTPLQAFQTDFVDRAKTGKAQLTPELQNAADFLRQADDDLYNEVKKHADVAYLENHHRVIWKVIPGSQAAMRGHPAARRPLQGSKGFLRQHVLEDMSEGIKDGGVPLSYNPIEQFTEHYRDAMRFVTARRWWDQAQKMKLRVFVKNGETPPENFDKLDDSIAKAYFRTEQGVFSKTGEWYVEHGMARLMNNYLSRDRLREPGTALGTAGSAMMAVKNLYTSVELGFSGFHFIFVSGEVGSSNIGLALSQFANRLVRGDLSAIPDIAKNFASGITVAPGARRAFRLGKASMDLLRSPEDFAQTPEGMWLMKEVPQARELMDDLFQGGGKLDVNHDYIRNWMRNFRTAAQEGNYPGAFFRAFPATIEALQYPLFQWYIPRVKVGVFIRELSEQLIQRNADITAGKISRATLAREVWDFVEDRFGEMNFDNVFWNRTFKTAMQILLRSPTWRLGSVRAIGKAFVGQATEVREALGGGQKPRVPLLTMPMSWLVGMSILTATFASIIQWMWTHRHPSQVKDIFFPRYDAKDDRMRFSFPTYGKEYYQLGTHPASYLTAGTGGALGKAAQIAKNRDFYGEKVWNEDDPAYLKALEIMKFAAPRPISYMSGKRVYEESGAGRAALSFLGINKAPAYVTRSAAEQLLDKYQNENAPPGSRPHEQQEHLKARSKAVREMREGKGTSAIGEGLKAGTLNRKDIASIQKSARLGPLQGRFMHSDLSLSQALDVYEAASSDERKQLRSAMAHKIFLARSKPWEMAGPVRSKMASLGFGHPSVRAVNQ